jgi:hypothetical protein
MKRLALVPVIALAIGVQLSAQERPDFSGAWRGSTALLSIKQSPTTLTVTKDSETYTYNLDGSESRWTGPRSQKTARVRWVQSALVVETRTISPTGSWTDMEVYSLDHGKSFGAPQLSVVYVFTRETGPMMGTSVTTYTRQASPQSK